jgi:hypothetical protein
VSWIPSHEGAKALIEMRDASYDILHLVHPQPVLWTSLITPIAQAMRVPLVTYPEWLSALNRSMENTSFTDVERMRRNPALKLIEFFRRADLSEDKEPLDLPRLSTEHAVKVSKALNSTMPQLSGKDALRWFEAWQMSGFTCGV